MKPIFYLTAVLIVALVWSCRDKSKQMNNSSNMKDTEKATEKGFQRDELVKRLVRAGELEISGENQVEVDTYFDTINFRFHGPDGFEAEYAGLTNYFKSIRAAFDDRSIKRGIIVAEGDHIACQTWIEGKFVREFTQSPVGTLPPNGKQVVFDLINIFRFDDQGRLVEEWVHIDNRSLLKQLGAQGK